MNTLKRNHVIAKSVQVFSITYNLHDHGFFLFLKSFDIRFVHEVIRRLPRFLTIKKVIFTVCIYVCVWKEKESVCYLIKMTYQIFDNAFRACRNQYITQDFHGRHPHCIMKSCSFQLKKDIFHALRRCSTSFLFLNLKSSEQSILTDNNNSYLTIERFV